MIAVINDIDRLLQAAPVRTLNPSNADVILMPSAAGFHVDGAGVPDISLITVTATLIGLEGAVSFAAQGVVLSEVGDRTATLKFTDMQAPIATVYATVVSGGEQFVRHCVIGTLRDGKPGENAAPPDLSPEALKAILEGQITESQLYASLRTRIDLVDAVAGVPGSVAARVKAETDARIAALTQEASDRKTYVQNYAYSKAATDESLSMQASTITAQYKTYADAARTAAVNTASADVRNYAYSKASSDEALTALATTLRSEFASNNGATTAWVESYAYSRAGTDSAISSMATQLRSEFASNNGASVSWVQEYAYSKAQADSAIASQTSALRTTVGDHTTTLQTQGTSINGLSAQYTVKIDNNGYVTGYGLASTVVNGTPTSSFIVNADRFAVVAPGIAPKTMFSVGNVNGQSTIGINGNAIIDGSFIVRKADGTPILTLGGLQPGFEAPGTKNSDITQGGFINRDPNFADSSAWEIAINASGGTVDFAFVPGAAGAVAASGVRVTANNANSEVWLLEKKMYPIDSKRVYELSANLFTTAGNTRVAHLAIQFYTASGAHIGNNITGWGGNWSGYAWSGVPPVPGAYGTVSGEFGNGRLKAIPSNAAQCRIGIILNYGATGTIGALMTAQMLTIRDVTAVAAAQATADAAKAAVEAISSDGILSGAEKLDVVRMWQAIHNEQAGIDAQADSLGVSRSDYDAKKAALLAYLQSLGSSNTDWSNTTKNTSIVRDTFNSKFNDVYTAKQALINTMSAKAAMLADWPSVGGTGRPADNASADVKLVATGNIILTGNRAEKTLTNGYDSQVYSRDSYVGGAYASAVMDKMSRMMFGLNTDPTADANFASLDYAMFPQADGSLSAYESNVDKGAIGTYTIGDVLAVTYDGTDVRYLKNGTVLRTVTPAAPITAPIFFDSSFNTIGSAIANIRFGPMSNNSAGVKALAAQTAFNTALAAKLDTAGNQILRGPIALQDAGAIVIGTTDNGTVMASTGFATRFQGVTKFTLPIAGNPTFGGELTAPTGSIGSITLAANGHVKTANMTGWGVWPASGQTCAWFGPEGIMLGNWRDGRFLHAYGNGDLFMPGFEHSNGQLKLTSTILVNPDIQQAQLGMTGVPSSINGGSGLANSTAWLVYGSFTVTPTNVQGTATVDAFINVVEGEVRIYQNGNTITVSGRGTGGANGTNGRSNSATIFISVVDSKNRTAFARVNAVGNHGVIQ